LCARRSAENISCKSTIHHWGTQLRSCFRHCATCRKVSMEFSPSNSNEYQEYFLGVKGSQCVRLTTLPHSCFNCFEIWQPQPPGNLKACPGLFYYTSLSNRHFSVHTHTWPIKTNKLILQILVYWLFQEWMKVQYS
jgi:hypothetical protein